MNTLLPAPSTMSFWIKKAFNHFYPDMRFHPDADAPNSWEELKRLANAPSLPVYSGDCESSIYAEPEDNIIFRAWHDAIHLDRNLSFKPADEYQVADTHVTQLKWLKAPADVMEAIETDIKAQVDYYAATKEFVGDQESFIKDCLWFGKDAVIDQVKQGKRY